MNSLRVGKTLLISVAVLFFLPSFSVQKAATVSIQRLKTAVSLEGDWEFRRAGSEDWHRATVPGCVHTDLMANGMIPDPFFRDNELRVQWVEEEDWEYRKVLDLSPAFLSTPRLDLVFEGLDTFAEIRVNGEKLAETSNMFREYRFDVKPLLKPGQNEVRVLFRSAVKEEKSLEKNLPYQLPGGAPHVRKAPFHFGWDWGPRLVTCGIWRPVSLESWSEARLTGMEIEQEFQPSGSVVLRLKPEVLSDIEGEAVLQVYVEGRSKHAQTETVGLKKGLTRHELKIPLHRPDLWWPAGLGDQNLYSVRVELLHNSRLLDSLALKTGIRRLELVQKEDEWGTSFAFAVNGIPFFAKGANWIPADIFLPRVTREKYKELLTSAVAANMNMLRVWGGGVYESPDFYDLCDELGLVLWQDFMFACAMFPGDQAFLSNVRAEAEHVVRSLRHHPSLALWCGNNECEEGWFHWGWKESLPSKVWTDYEEIFHRILPEAVEVLDPQRSYWPSSPHSLVTGDPRSEASGDMHDWSVWHGREPFEEYRKRGHRFLSEFGFQSFPLFETVKTYTRPEDWNLTSPVMEHHQKHPIGNRLILHYLLDRYRLPKDFPSLLWLSQVLQAEGTKIAVEHFRSRMPRIMGSLYWQFDDCWQVASWSGLDYFGTWKALHYYARRFYAPVLVTPIERDGSLAVYVVSDTPFLLDASLHWSVRTYEGRILREQTLPLTVGSRESRIVYSAPLSALHEGVPPEEAYFDCRLEDDRGVISSNVFHFSRLKRVSLPDPGITAEVTEGPKGPVVVLQAAKFAECVFLEAEGLKGRFEDNFFDLVPGRLHRVTFLGREAVSAVRLEQALRILSLRDTY